MPFDNGWRNPQRFLTCRGKGIFHTYREDSPDIMNQFHYTTYWDDTDTEYHFDVRDLALRFRGENLVDHKAIIRRAIAENLIKFPLEFSMAAQKPATSRKKVPTTKIVKAAAKKPRAVPTLSKRALALLAFINTRQHHIGANLPSWAGPAEVTHFQLAGRGGRIKVPIAAAREALAYTRTTRGLGKMKEHLFTVTPAGKRILAAAGL